MQPSQITSGTFRLLGPDLLPKDEPDAIVAEFGERVDLNLG